MKNKRKWSSALWATLLLCGTAARGATFTLPEVAVHGTISYESAFTEWGLYHFTGASNRQGTLVGENGFVYDHQEFWGLWGYYQASFWLRYDPLPVESVSLDLSYVNLPSAGHGSISVDINGDTYIIPLTGYVASSSGSRTEAGVGSVTHYRWQRDTYRAIPEPAPIPEPATFGMAVSCFAGLLLHAWRRRRGLTGRQ